MAKAKKTARELKRELAELKKHIRALEKKARKQGLTCTSLNDDQLIRKLRGETSNSPLPSSPRFRLFDVVLST